MDMNSLKQWYEITNAKMAFGDKARSKVYKKLATLMRTGIPLRDSLLTINEHLTDSGKKQNPVSYVLKDVLRKIANGQSLARALNDWIPPNDRILIDAGEQAGKTEQALENTLYMQENSKRIKNEIIVISYPIVLLIAITVFLFIFTNDIVPAFEQALTRDKWVGIPAYMAQIGDFLNSWLIYILIVMGVIGGVAFWSLPRWTGDLRVKFDSFPPWSLYRLNAGVGFMLSFAALYKAGVSIPEILKILMKGSNPWYRERIKKTLAYVNNGLNIGEALYKTGFNFPDKETVIDMRTFSAQDGFDDILEKMAKDWLEENVQKVKAQMKIFFYIALLTLATLVGMIASSIFSLQTQVSAAIGH